MVKYPSGSFTVASGLNPVCMVNVLSAPRIVELSVGTIDTRIFLTVFGISTSKCFSDMVSFARTSFESKSTTCIETFPHVSSVQSAHIASSLRYTFSPTISFPTFISDAISLSVFFDAVTETVTFPIDSVPFFVITAFHFPALTSGTIPLRFFLSILLQLYLSPSGDIIFALYSPLSFNFIKNVHDS